MFESKYSKVLTIILTIVIIAIVALLGFLTLDYIQKYTVSRQASDFVENFQGNITTEEENSNQNIIENITEENINIVFNQSEVQVNTNTSGSSSGKKTYNGCTVAGTMKIPAINFEYPILEQISSKALETAVVVLYPSSDNLNQPGNTVIIGHNFRNGLFFSNLKKLSNGAKIYVTDYTGKSITYEVYNIFVTSSTDTSFYSRDTNGLAELTLSTCTDASNDQRTIVFAKELR